MYALIFNMISPIISGEQSRDPTEACSSWYFKEKESPLVTLVQGGGHNRKPCPFNGVYSVSGNLQSIADLVSSPVAVSRDECAASDTVMHVGCGDSSHHSSNIRIQQSCNRGDPSNARRGSSRNLVTIDLTNDLVCHGSWRHSSQWGSQAIFDNNGATMTSAAMMIDDNFVESATSQRRRQTRQQQQLNDVLVLSVKPKAAGQREKFLCLTYTELPDGVLSAYVGPEACNYTLSSDDTKEKPSASYYSSRRQKSSSLPYLSDALSLSLSSSLSGERGAPQGAWNTLPFANTFNISSSGPCVQALKGGAPTIDMSGMLLAMLVINLMRVICV